MTDAGAEFVSSDPEVADVDASGTIAARGDGSATVTVRRGALEATVPVDGQGLRRRAADQLRQPGRADLHQARLQHRRLPRQGERPERVPALPARLRADVRLRDAREGRPRPAALPGRARAEPAAAQGRPARCPTAAASGWKSARTSTGSIRRWIAAGMPFGKATDPTVARIEIYPDARVMPRGRDAAVRRHRPLHRRHDRGRHPLGPVPVQRHRDRRRRRRRAWSRPASSPARPRSWPATRGRSPSSAPPCRSACRSPAYPEFAVDEPRSTPPR